MSEILKIPWGQVLSNFVWILGVAIILATFNYNELFVHLQKAKITELVKRSSFKKPVIVGLILIIVGVGTSSLLHIFSKPKETVILKDRVKFPPSSFEGRKIIEDDLIKMPWGGVIKSKTLQFEKSKYKILIISKGSEALGETAQLKVYIGFNLIADFFTSVEYKEKTIEFTSEKEQLKRLIIEFANDYYDPKKNLDRNVWIRSVEILKIDNT